MKKRLAALDVKIQIALVAIGVLIVGFVGRMVVVSPQKTKAAELRKQIDDVKTQVTTRQLQARSASRPQPIKVADLFRLAKAMPEREDMPGIILTISQVARAAGIHFDTIEPRDAGAPPAGNIQMRPIHLTFNGDFYALSDFLYRLRTLVTVHDGRLDASGRLFTIDSMTFTLPEEQFPRISADLVVNTYVYGAPAPVAPVPVPGATPTPATTTGTTTTSTTTTTDTTSTPAAPPGATAAAAP